MSSVAAAHRSPSASSGPPKAPAAAELGRTFKAGRRAGAEDSGLCAYVVAGKTHDGKIAVTTFGSVET